MRPFRSPSPSQPKQATLLLVEDHDDYRQVVKLALNSFLPDWLVLEGDSVAAASEVLQNSAVDVLVCDLTLPDGLAFDLLDRLAQISPGQIKVIIISNHSAEQLEAIPERADIHGYFTKERGLKELAHLIEQVAGLESNHPARHVPSALPTFQA